jgi:hypothetical protein
MPLSFKATSEEYALFSAIVERYAPIYKQHTGENVDRMSLHMDLTACHANGTALDLQRLLDAPQFDFVHDVAGIQRHINRDTGKLENCFHPRTARPG